MNILFTVCARAGSKGLRNKNLKYFLGEPLSFYTFSVINLYSISHPENRCVAVLNTDSEPLIELATQKLVLDIEIIRRNPALAGDAMAKDVVIGNCYNVISERKQMDFDMVVDLDVTSPLRTLDDLEKLIAKKADSEYDVVFSVTESRRNPYFNMVKRTDDGYTRVIASSFTARQQAPEIYDMNASMYAYSPAFLKSGKGLFEGRCGIIKMTDTGILDIDSEADFELLQVVAEHVYKSDEAFRRVVNHIKNCTRR